MIVKSELNISAKEIRDLLIYIERFIESFSYMMEHDKTNHVSTLWEDLNKK